MPDFKTKIRALCFNFRKSLVEISTSRFNYKTFVWVIHAHCRGEVQVSWCIQDLLRYIIVPWILACRGGASLIPGGGGWRCQREGRKGTLFLFVVIWQSSLNFVSKESSVKKHTNFHYWRTIGTRKAYSANCIQEVENFSSPLVNSFYKTCSNKRDWLFPIESVAADWTHLSEDYKF